jgi:hypothetical protein
MTESMMMIIATTNIIIIVVVGSIVSRFDIDELERIETQNLSLQKCLSLPPYLNNVVLE